MRFQKKILPQRNRLLVELSFAAAGNCVVARIHESSCRAYIFVVFVSLIFVELVALTVSRTLTSIVTNVHVALKQNSKANLPILLGIFLKKCKFLRHQTFLSHHLNPFL